MGDFNKAWKDHLVLVSPVLMQLHETLGVNFDIHHKHEAAPKLFVKDISVKYHDQFLKQLTSENNLCSFIIDVPITTCNRYNYLNIKNQIYFRILPNLKIIKISIIA